MGWMCAVSHWRIEYWRNERWKNDCWWDLMSWMNDCRSILFFEPDFLQEEALAFFFSNVTSRFKISFPIDKAGYVDRRAQLLFTPSSDLLSSSARLSSSSTLCCPSECKSPLRPSCCPPLRPSSTSSTQLPSFSWLLWSSESHEHSIRFDCKKASECCRPLVPLEGRLKPLLRERKSERLLRSLAAFLVPSHFALVQLPIGFLHWGLAFHLVHANVKLPTLWITKRKTGAVWFLGIDRRFNILELIADILGRLILSASSRFPLNTSFSFSFPFAQCFHCLADHMIQTPLLFEHSTCTCVGPHLLQLLVSDLPFFYSRTSPTRKNASFQEIGSLPIP